MEYIMEMGQQMGQQMVGQQMGQNLQHLEIETDMFNHFYDFEPPCIKKQHREAKRKEMEEAEMLSDTKELFREFEHMAAGTKEDVVTK
jgi:hypothetical protein